MNRYNIEIDTTRECALPLEVTERDGKISFWGDLGCSRDYAMPLRAALVAFLREHGRGLIAVIR